MCSMLNFNTACGQRGQSVVTGTQQGLWGGLRAGALCQTPVARKEQWYPHRKHRGKSLVTRNGLGCFQGMAWDVSKGIITGPRGPRKLRPQTAEKFLFMPLNHAQLLHVLENRLLVTQQRAAMENDPWRLHALCILQTINRHRVNKT